MNRLHPSCCTRFRLVLIAGLVGVAVPLGASAQPIVPATGVTAPKPKKALKLFGDVRLRFDVDMRSGTGTADDADDRSRPRLRARLGARYRTKVKGLSFGMRLATNAGTPGNSPHQTLDGGAANVFTLDRAYIKYQPAKGVTLIGGKQGWLHWQQTEILWDEDIQPEGFAAKYERDLGSSGKVGVNAGMFYLGNVGWTSKPFRNDALVTAQVRHAGSFDRGRLRSTVALTGVLLQDRGTATNVATNSAGDTMYDFDDVSFLMASLQLKSKHVANVTITGGFDFVVSDADADNLVDEATTGYVGQLRLQYKRYGVRYYYYYIEEASVPFWGSDNTFSQDNFANSRGGGLTGFQGHRVQLDWSPGNGVGVDLRGYLSKGLAGNDLSFAETAGRKIIRIQLNVNAKF